MPPSSTANCIIRLDSGNLDHAVAFWQSLVGYEETARIGEGTPLERRMLHSPNHPAVDLELTACLPRPPVGSMLGSLRSFAFRVSDPAAVARQVRHAQWIQPIDPAAPSPDSVMLIDPSGYRVELIRD